MSPPYHLEALPYRADTAALFEPIASEPWAVLLDSNVGLAAGGRWDIVALSPRVTLRTRGAVTELRTGSLTRQSNADPIALLREVLGAGTAPGPAEGLPFVGGAIGWFGYDLARRFERLGSMRPLPACSIQMAVGVYDWALVVDHHQRASWLVGRGDPTDPRCERLRRLAEGRARAQERSFRITGMLRSDMDRGGYARRFRAVHEYIRNGDCYQVNLARRWSVSVAGSAWTAYRRLRRLNPAPFAAFLNSPGMQVLSASPERFLAVRGGVVETRPIKGTAARHPDPLKDRKLAAALAASDKDMAENLMIVDLLRNDLGRCCEIGSVQVPELFRVESYAGVHHLVSTVIGRLRADQDAATLLRACFPGGSITGAPKIRTMQIIDELECAPRGVYCGSIGYLGFDGNMDTNIAIRTASIADGRLEFRAGGGLVAESDLDAEWAEIGLKAWALLELVASFGQTQHSAQGGSPDSLAAQCGC
jgi:para-aminobenzoate synthetase component 1